MIYPDYTNSKFDVRYHQAKVLFSDILIVKDTNVSGRGAIDIEDTFVEPGSGSGTNLNIDGGFAAEEYMLGQNVDGGFAATIYNSGQTISGGNA